MPTNYHNLLTLAQAAARAERSERTVCRWIRDGQLVGVRLGGRWFVHQQALEDHLLGPAMLSEEADES